MWRTPIFVVGSGCLIAMIAFGPRSTLGFFLTPLSSANHWGRDVFAFALAVQNLLWGIGQPLRGIIADRFGTVRVLCAGAILYALGLDRDGSRRQRHGDGLVRDAGRFRPCRLFVPDRAVRAAARSCRSNAAPLAFGLGTAAGSFGQFLYSPVAVALMDKVGWQEDAAGFRRQHAGVLPLSLALATPPAETRSGRIAVAAASAQRSLRASLLCAAGARLFHLRLSAAFITVHLPAYLVDRGLSAEIGGWTLAIIGLFNIVGSITTGWLGNRMPKRYVLSSLYFTRAAAIFVFISFPVTAIDLHRLRRGHGLDVAVDRAADQRHHRGDVRHALAGDALGLCLFQPSGRRLPRRLARRHRVRPHRFLRSGVVARDPVRRALRR